MDHEKSTIVDSIASKSVPQKGKLQVNSLTADIFLQIGDLLSGVELGFKYPSLVAHHGIEGAVEFLRMQNQKDIRRRVKKMEETDLLKTQKIGERFMIRFSDKGKEEYLRLKIMKADMLPKDRYCLVVFDVPESQKEIRQELRRLLTIAAFIPIQRSVWASPFDAAEEIARYLDFKDRRKWVRIFVTDETL